MKKNIIILSIACLFFQCKNTDNDKTKTDIIGHWNIESAYRDNSETETLRGIYFDFKIDSLTTNFNEELADKSSGYSIKDKIIRLNNIPSSRFNIDSISQNYLLLNTIVQNRKFDLILKKN